MGNKSLMFGTDSSPVLLDADLELVATLGPTLNGAIRFKDAGSYNFSRNMAAYGYKTYYVDDEKDVYEFDLADQVTKNPPYDAVTLSGKVISQGIEEISIDKKTGKLYMITDNGIITKYPTNLSNIVFTQRNQHTRKVPRKTPNFLLRHSRRWRRCGGWRL